MSDERLYRLHFVHDDGRHEVLTPHLMTHKEACTVQAKCLPQTAARSMLVEGAPHPCVDHDKADARGRGAKRYCLECLEEIADAATAAQRPPGRSNRQTRAD